MNKALLKRPDFKTMILIGCLAFNNSMTAQESLKYPESRKHDVADTYFGKMVEDPYRWLEDDRSFATEDWVKKQNEVTENYFQKISQRSAIKTRLTELWNYSKQTAPFK